MKPSLCLNMIVKNEAARIDRCLLSVLPYVKSVVILDTGSTDDTINKIKRLCQDDGVPYEIVVGTFENFSQARNDAFELAQNRNGKGQLQWCQFALMMDADMELVVEDPKVFHRLSGADASYDMIQKGGVVSYANRRVVNLTWGKPPYVGVTHEYIDIPSQGMIKGAHFIDHADGANRADKFERDVTLLEEGLRSEPNNGRYWYYLGNSYRDWGRPIEAIAAYQRRVDLGGWDEETHSAMMGIAGCWKDRGLDSAYVSGLNDAFNFRPTRAEPLYDLAKHYREKGMNSIANLYAKHGMNIPRPNDLLFVNDFVYSHGLRYEYSVTGYYEPKERNCAFQVTDDLALDPTCNAEVRASARSNLFWYTLPLSHYCPSFKGKRLDFVAPEGYTAMNPAVEQFADHVYCNIRCVNYTIDEHGRYMIGEQQCGDAPIVTRNFIVKLDDNLNVYKSSELLWSRPEPAWDMVIGLEDVRLWHYNGQLHFNACVRELSYEGTCQQVIGSVSYNLDTPTMSVDRWRVVDMGSVNEKNWMHFHDQRFIYRLDTIITPFAGLDRALPRQTPVEKFDIKVAADQISGSSQLIPFKAGYLAVVHEAANDPTNNKRTYWHRFAWFDGEGRLFRLSLPFVFYERQIEFCAGLAKHPNGDDLILSFGVRDAEAHVATVSIEEVSRMIWKFHEG